MPSHPKAADLPALPILIAIATLQERDKLNE